MARFSRIRVLPLLALPLLLLAIPVEAHMLKIFATTAGARIDGRVYFVGGGPARSAAIRIETPEGETLFTLHADHQGRFTVDAERRADHVIIADSGEGHAARLIIPADSLPGTLAAAPAASSAGTHIAHAAPPPEQTEALAPPAAEAMEALVARAVAAQVQPLREQLNAYEDRLRLRDVLGGLGYIMGLAGLALWLRDRRRGRPG